MTERKPIDSGLRRFIDEQTAAFSPLAGMADEERARIVRERMVRALQTRTSIPGLPNRVETRELEISSGLRACLYLPHVAAAPSPVLVYLHGGGWVGGSVATHDPFCRLLSHASGVILVTVDYRLAPEHPYPAAVEDTLAAARWTREHAADWGGRAAAGARGRQLRRQPGRSCSQPALYRARMACAARFAVDLSRH